MVYPEVIPIGGIPQHSNERLAESEMFTIKPVGTEPPKDNLSSLTLPSLSIIMGIIFIVTVLLFEL
jgi:hypothetical protein